MTQWNLIIFYSAISFNRPIIGYVRCSNSLSIIEFSIMSDLCIACNKVVGKRQHGVTCDVCDQWQHRICDTGNKYLMICFCIFCFGLIFFEGFCIYLTIA